MPTSTSVTRVRLWRPDDDAGVEVDAAVVCFVAESDAAVVARVALISADRHPAAGRVSSLTGVAVERIVLVEADVDADDDARIWERLVAAACRYAHDRSMTAVAVTDDPHVTALLRRVGFDRAVMAEAESPTSVWARSDDLTT